MPTAIVATVAHPKLPGLLTRFLDRLARWQENARQRRALLHLGPQLMKDIGITEADIWLETSKPFWRD
ncbi:MAG: DUF1127 domain-containing protein [Rhodospirillaceae bacterium]|nr:DUF1127 domain-containing protein [Rhodospirillaceae bacterium]